MKKLVALLMTMSMAVSLAACGNSDTQENTGNVAETSQAQESSSAEASTSVEAPAEKQDVSLTMWGAEEDQAMLQSMIDSFKEHYADYYIE